MLGRIDQEKECSGDLELMWKKVVENKTRKISIQFILVMFEKRLFVDIPIFKIHNNFFQHRYQTRFLFSLKIKLKLLTIIMFLLPRQRP